ncbi:hypothetical protein [Legionella worsleiensis]|nr:hypothetical protein [Legionella worsleiensis]
MVNKTDFNNHMNFFRYNPVQHGLAEFLHPDFRAGKITKNWAYFVLETLIALRCIKATKLPSEPSP